jgi:hypothetical protein
MLQNGPVALEPRGELGLEVKEKFAQVYRHGKAFLVGGLRWASHRQVLKSVSLGFEPARTFPELGRRPRGFESHS